MTKNLRSSQRNRVKSFRVVSQVRQFVLGITSLGILATIPLSYPSAAQAGIFDFLFGRRRGASNARGRRSGGAVRDECPVQTAEGQLVDFSSFQALAPEDNRILTADAYPTFWFNVPFSASDNLRHVEFMLIHEDDKTYALEQPLQFDLPREPGVVKVQLPTTANGLERDRAYQWFFSIQCDDVELSRNPVLTGTIVYPSVLAVNQQPWPNSLVRDVGGETSPDWQELVNAPLLIPVSDP